MLWVRVGDDGYITAVSDGPMPDTMALDIDAPDGIFDACYKFRINGRGGVEFDPDMPVAEFTK
jgi:hypothetical protein